ncbi:hypothetical protein BC832DRAFT_420203 [Gaertneriomyces semiglobifer]|nr:hypothetical protein BC832DRAFT_420203 [Gaertneriomyces semiglobifer]
MDLMSNQASQHFNKGVQHLATSLQLDGSNDLFLFFYLKLLLASGSYTKARDSARKFVRANPKQPNGYRYLLQIYHRHFKDSPEWVQLAEKLLVIDPVCDEELALRPLVQHYESLSDSVGDNVDTPCALRIMRVLAARIDYDKGGPWIWKQLALCLRSVNANHDGADEDIWKDRRGWWFGWCFLQTNSAKVTLSEGSENVLYKLICAFYIFRESFPFLSLPKMYGITAQSTSTALLDKFGISKHAFLESKARQGNQAFAHTARYVTGTATQPTQEDVEDALSMFWGSLKDEICGEAPAHPGFVEERATLMSEETWSKTNADTTARQPPPSPIPIGQTFSRHIQPPMQQSDERPRKKRRTKGF